LPVALYANCMKILRIMKPSIIVLQDTRRAKDGDKYPIKLRLTYQRKQVYYSIGVDLTKDEFECTKGSEIKKELRDCKLRLIEFEAKADRIVEHLPNFSFQRFERQFFEQSAEPDNVYHFFDEKINKLKESGRLGTAVSYQCAKNSLQ
jgi:integrase/recombinase XerD